MIKNKTKQKIKPSAKDCLTDVIFRSILNCILFSFMSEVQTLDFTFGVIEEETYTFLSKISF